jgi:hypothetical protein
VGNRNFAEVGYCRHHLSRLPTLRTERKEDFTRQLRMSGLLLVAFALACAVAVSEDCPAHGAWLAATALFPQETGLGLPKRRSGIPRSLSAMHSDFGGDRFFTITPHSPNRINSLTKIPIYPALHSKW